VAELRNVVVFALGTARFAIELRWIREVVSLGFVTAVPTAPAAIAGVFNLHGQILPVLDLPALQGGPPSPMARQGDGALVLDAEGGTCALRIDQVDHVASLADVDATTAAAAGPPRAGVLALLADGGRAVPLLDPVHLLRHALELVAAASEPPPP
jgi:chemotaxis-related protein WspB